MKCEKCGEFVVTEGQSFCVDCLRKITHEDLMVEDLGGVIRLSADGPEGLKAMGDAINILQEETDRAIEAEAETLGVSFNDMSLVHYLRSRSRWTQEKEDYLIELAREGKPLPNVLSGEF